MLQNILQIEIIYITCRQNTPTAFFNLKKSPKNVIIMSKMSANKVCYIYFHYFILDSAFLYNKDYTHYREKCQMFIECQQNVREHVNIMATSCRHCLGGLTYFSTLLGTLQKPLHHVINT